MTIDEMIEAAAKRHRCWSCDAEPGRSCYSDYSDDGLRPCYPHQDRLMWGARDVIEELLRKGTA